jgi:hypothetical protein
MGSGLNIIAATLFIIWMVEYFGYNAGQNIHIVLLVSIIIVLTKALTPLPVKEQTENGNKTTIR